MLLLYIVSSYGLILAHTHTQGCIVLSILVLLNILFNRKITNRKRSAQRHQTFVSLVLSVLLL